MARIKRIGVIFSGKLLAIYGAGMGLLAGLIYAVGGFGIDLLVSLSWITSSETRGLSSGTALAFLALIGMPVIFSCAGFLIGILGAFLYNLASKISGGIKLDLEVE